jgi:predicted DNA-binding protein
MATVTLSTRLAKEDARKIDELAANLGLDRGALLKQLIRKGLKEIQNLASCDPKIHFGGKKYGDFDRTDG